MSKYDSDGHSVDPNAEIIRKGTILRMISKDGGIAPFSDTVVIGMYIENKQGAKQVYETLAAAIRACNDLYPSGENDYRVVVELARPYLYANSIGIFFNCSQYVEKHSTSPNKILNFYKVVEMSTGEAANYNER